MPEQEKMDDMRSIALCTIISFNSMGDLDKRAMTPVQRMRIRSYLAATGLVLAKAILFEEPQFRKTRSPYLALSAAPFAAARSLRRRYKLARFCGWHAAEDEFYTRGAALAELYVDVVRARAPS